jgi:hypothetical protein
MFSHLRAFIWLPLNFKSEKFAKTIFFVEKNNRWTCVNFTSTCWLPISFCHSEEKCFCNFGFRQKKMLLSFSSWFCEYKGRNNPFLTTHLHSKREREIVRLRFYNFSLFMLAYLDNCSTNNCLKQYVLNGCKLCLKRCKK